MKTAAIKTLRDLPAIETATAVETAFDALAFNEAIGAFANKRAAAKTAAALAKLQDSKEEMALLFPAIAYAAATYDLQPLATYMLRIKPSALVKRAVLGVFPSHSFALVDAPKGKRPAYVLRDGLSKMVNPNSLSILKSAYESGDAFGCDQIKAAFPAPKATADEKKEAQAKALQRLLKAGLSKADIAAMLKEV